jgi:formamidopyrimidine-DNA glycosylase
MPELPEVETIVRGLQKQIVGISDTVGKKIIGVRVILPKLIRGDTEDFINLALGTIIKKVWRRGKMLVIGLSKGKSILISNSNYEKFSFVLWIIYGNMSFCR